MSRKKQPILLSFYGLSNGKQNLFFGKLAYSPTKDLVFKNYSRLKTFKTIVALYRTKGIRNQNFEMVFDHGVVKCTTDRSGSFWCEVEMDKRQTKLISITLTATGENVSLTENLYPNNINSITSDNIIITDLDDTLIHSFVSNKWKQIKTLLFTQVEKREAVTAMADLIRHYVSEGGVPFYLSNSEQNLYPMLYRFLAINHFPAGPLFLKQYVRLRNLFTHRVFGSRNIHKSNLLEKIMELFPDKKIILIGDNTQNDLSIYLEIAIKYPQNIRNIIIREVTKSRRHQFALLQAKNALKQYNIEVEYYTNPPLAQQMG